MTASKSPAFRRAHPAVSQSELAMGPLIERDIASLDVVNRTSEQARGFSVEDCLATLDLGIAMARDPDGTIRHWSKGCERLYGWTSKEAIGQISHVLLKTGFPVPLASIDATLAAEGVWSGDLRHVTKDGRTLSVTALKVLRRDEEGRPVAVMESIADVTAQKDAEARLIEKTEQLAQASKMEALGRLAGGMAHDFNNILQALQSSLELAVDADEQEERLRLFDLGTRLATRGAAITSRLLAFARQGKLISSAIAPTALLARLGEMLHPVIGPAIDMRVEASLALPALMADSAQLETVIVNLANNARDAMPNGGVLTLRASAATVPGREAAPPGLADGRYIRLSVIDEGEGIPSGMLARIIEPFFTTKPQGKGTGLGLAMAHGFALQSGGALSIDSEVGTGTTVSLWLPQAKDDAPARTGGATSPSGASAASRRARPERTILLVEDEENLRKILGRSLERHGYTVVLAASAPDALAYLAAGKMPDAVITDFAMPGAGNGLDLIRSIRQRTPRTPILLITGQIAGMSAADFDTEQQSIRFAVLRKPFATSALLEQLEGAIAAAGPAFGTASHDPAWTARPSPA